MERRSTFAQCIFARASCISTSIDMFYLPLALMAAVVTFIGDDSAAVAAVLDVNFVDLAENVQVQLRSLGHRNSYIEYLYVRNSSSRAGSTHATSIGYMYTPLTVPCYTPVAFKSNNGLSTFTTVQYVHTYTDSTLDLRRSRGFV